MANSWEQSKLYHNYREGCSVRRLDRRLRRSTKWRRARSRRWATGIATRWEEAIAGRATSLLKGAQVVTESTVRTTRVLELVGYVCSCVKSSYMHISIDNRTEELSIRMRREVQRQDDAKVERQLCTAESSKRWSKGRSVKPQRVQVLPLT